MTYLSDKEFYAEVRKGNVAGHSIVRKFGMGTVGTSLVPVTNDLKYETPTAAVALEFVSSDSNDTSAGSGAREITIEGLDASWNVVVQVIATNGTTAVAIPTSLIRMYRWYVSKSGTYATASAGSHAGVLTVRVASAGATWSTIPITLFKMGQSLIGAYTVPDAKTAYMIDAQVTIDTSKTVDVILFTRPNADVVSAPYTGIMTAQRVFLGLTGHTPLDGKAIGGGEAGPCDVGFLAKVTSGTSPVAVEFDILLVDD